MKILFYVKLTILKYQDMKSIHPTLHDKGIDRKENKNLKRKQTHIQTYL